MEREPLTQLQVRLPTKLKAEFCRYCESRDVTVSQALRRYMAQQVRKHGKKQE